MPPSKTRDPAQKMIPRNAIIEAELVEQFALVPCPPTHHRLILVANLVSRRNHCSRAGKLERNVVIFADRRAGVLAYVRSGEQECRTSSSSCQGC